MDIEDIEELRNGFFDEEKIKHSNPKNISEYRARGMSLDKTEFIEIMEKLAGSSMISLAAAKLFESLDVHEEGFLRWETIVDAIIEKTRAPLERKEKNWQPINSEVLIHYASHCKVHDVAFDLMLCYFTTEL